MIFILNLIHHATFHGHNSMYVRMRAYALPFREGCGYSRSTPSASAANISAVAPLRMRTLALTIVMESIRKAAE